MRRRGSVVTFGWPTCVPLNTFGKFHEELRPRHRADDGDVEQAVVEARASGVMRMPPAYAGPLPTATSHAAVSCASPSTVRRNAVRLVDGERAQHRRDVERGARQPAHGVGPAVGLGVEARRGDARVPAAVHPAEVDDAVVAVLERVERVERLLGVVAEHAGEVVARAGRHDREPPAGVGGDARDLGDEPVAAARDEIVPVVGRGARELGRRAGLGRDVRPRCPRRGAARSSSGSSFGSGPARPPD